jgi:hypothetical protein
MRLVAQVPLLLTIEKAEKPGKSAKALKRSSMPSMLGLVVAVVCCSRVWGC